MILLCLIMILIFYHLHCHWHNFHCHLLHCHCNLKRCLSCIIIEILCIFILCISFSSFVLSSYWWWSSSSPESSSLALTNIQGHPCRSLGQPWVSRLQRLQGKLGPDHPWHLPGHPPPHHHHHLHHHHHYYQKHHKHEQNQLRRRTQCLRICRKAITRSAPSTGETSKHLLIIISLLSSS